MEKINCIYCNTIFKTISSLNNHQKKAKYCLILQGKIEKNIVDFRCNVCNKILSSKQNFENHIRRCKIVEEKDFTCNVCNKILSSKRNYENHIRRCKIVEEKDFICNVCNKILPSKENFQNHIKKCKIVEEKDFTCNFCEKTLSSKHSLIYHLDICSKKKTKDIDLLKNEFQEKLNEYKDQITILQNKLDKITNKAIDRPTITNINNKFELSTFPSQLEIDRKIESQFNDKYLFDGIKGVAQFVFDHIVTLEDGSIAYACFDTSRQVFKYKDENGNEIKDPKAVKLRKMLKPGLLRQSQTLLDYFRDECNYLENRKNKGLEIDSKEYNIMSTLREKAFEVGCEILGIEDTNKFSNELASLSCL